MAEIFQRQARPEADWAAREFAALYAAILPWQDESGAFHDVLNDPGTFLETEFTEMFAYSALKMVSLGMLQKNGAGKRSARPRLRREPRGRAGDDPRLRRFAHL